MDSDDEPISPSTKKSFKRKKPISNCLIEWLKNKATCKNLQLLQPFGITNIRKLSRENLIKKLKLDVTPLSDWQIEKIKTQMEEQLSVKKFNQKMIQQKNQLNKGFITDWTLLKIC